MESRGSNHRGSFWNILGKAIILGTSLCFHCVAVRGTLMLPSVVCCGSTCPHRWVPDAGWVPQDAHAETKNRVQAALWGSALISASVGGAAGRREKRVSDAISGVPAHPRGSSVAITALQSCPKVSPGAGPSHPCADQHGAGCPHRRGVLWAPLCPSKKPH